MGSDHCDSITGEEGRRYPESSFCALVSSKFFSIDSTLSRYADQKKHFTVVHPDITQRLLSAADIAISTTSQSRFVIIKLSQLGLRFLQK
jgi:hypothetical protein